MTRKTISLPENTIKRLKDLATADGRTLSQFMVAVLNERCAKSKFEPNVDFGFEDSPASYDDSIR